VIQGYVIGEVFMPTANSTLYHASLLHPPDTGEPNKFAFKYIHPTVSQTLVDGECESNQALRHCPNLIVGTDFVTVEGSVGYFMRKCVRGDLLDFILANDLDEPSVAQMSFRIVEALAFMHDLGWAHRDIKPDNIFLDGSEKVPDTFLADLGFAAVGPFEAPLGSHSYEAPELLEAAPYDTAVDIWAFGVVIFAMLAGCMPFPDPEEEWEEFSSRVVAGQWDDEWLAVKNVSDHAYDLIGRCLSVDPAARPTARDLLVHPFFDGCRVMDVNATVETLGELLEGPDDLDYGDGAT
jgi:serine/threonine protein kinase